MNRHAALVAVLLVLGVAGAAGWWFFQRVGPAWRPALDSREVATRVLGEHLARVFPGAKALVIGNPFTLRSGQDPEIYAFEKAGIRGLELGFGGPGAIRVVYPELHKEFLERPASVYVDPRTTTPLSYLVADGEFDRLAKANPGYDLIVSLIGLPLGIGESEVWLTTTTKPFFGLLLPDWRIIGGPEAVQQAVKSGKIAAAVINRRGASAEADADAGADYHAEFERRFVLVTKENIDNLLRIHLQLW